MQERRVTLPLSMLAAVGVTRGMLGLGAGLLVADKLDREHRTLAGLVLLGIGVVSTIPIALTVFRRRQSAEPDMPRTREGVPRMVH